MQLGRFTIEQLNEGQFEFFPDGRINRTPVSETRNTSEVPAKRALVGINPLYISDGRHHILLDTGLGWGLDAGSSYSDISNICTNLDIFDVQPREITHVILSHLHYDHAAGLSYTDEHASTCPTFPNATCYVQQSEWDYAVSKLQQNHFYRLDDLYRLYADNFFKLIDNSSKEIVPGIELIKTGGHTPGHQIVKITGGESRAYFLGDLVSSPDQLNRHHITAGHANRMQSKKMKIQLLRQIFEENALLYLYHSLKAKPGRLAMDEDENYILRELE